MAWFVAIVSCRTVNRPKDRFSASKIPTDFPARAIETSRKWQLQLLPFPECNTPLSRVLRAAPSYYERSPPRSAAALQVNRVRFETFCLPATLETPHGTRNPKRHAASLPPTIYPPRSGSVPGLFHLPNATTHLLGGLHFRLFRRTEESAARLQINMRSVWSAMKHGCAIPIQGQRDSTHSGCEPSKAVRLRIPTDLQTLSLIEVCVKR